MGKENKTNGLLTTLEAAKEAQVHRQTVYIAIKKGNLKATKKNLRFTISIDDLNEYRVRRFSREKRMLDGKKIFNIEDGDLSIKMASKILSKQFEELYPQTPSRYTRKYIYELVRCGDIKAHKVGGMWVIRREEIEKILEKHAKKAESQLGLTL